MGKLTIILPDFIMIGANKAGTTSIASYLSQHPEIKMSDVKEPMFFTSDPRRASSDRSSATLGKPYFVNSLEEYSSMFSRHNQATKIFGEASTSYLASPNVASKNIKKIVPDIKLIAILREPASRALSAYKMCFGNGIESRSFREIVEDSRGHNRILQAHGVKEYVRNGLYGQLLKPYVEMFDRKQMLFLAYDDLERDPSVFMDKIISFLGASPCKLRTKKRLNTAQENLKEKLLINECDLKQLKTFFQEDIVETEKITGLDLSAWKKV